MSESDEEKEFNDESSDDVPMSSLASPGGKRRRTSAVTSYAEEENDDEEEEEAEFDEGNNDDDDDDDDNDDDDDDDDDDVPLSSLASPSPKKKKTVNGSKTNGKKKVTPKKKATLTKKKAEKKPTVSASSSSWKSASAAFYGTECAKGMLVQRLLCRWWYAIEWPDASAIPKEPPATYDPLDGFPGIYVCTEGDEVGAIKDLRDKDKAPTFMNMAKKSSEELQTLLLKALTEQRQELVQAEGKGTDTEKELDTLIKWTKKIKPTTAEKEAAKVLKAGKFTLD